MDATGTNILRTYESGWFTTNNPAGIWTNLMAIGVAPAGAVYGRTVVGLLGTNAGFGGTVWIDDVTQRVVATGGTVSGLLWNPGFDDGPGGNAYYLGQTNDLPNWVWNGGDNAGYIASDYKLDGEQALVITYPQNGISQDLAVGAGKSYRFEGYLFTPAASKFTTDGTSHGQLEMAFFTNGSVEAAAGFTRISAPFDANPPANTWIYFSVTGIAPNAFAVTARVTCTIASADPGSDFDLGGVIYFDHLSVTELGGQTPFEAWQIANFGSTTGPRTGMQEDYDDDGYVNWCEFIAGTQPTNVNSYLALSAGTAAADRGRYIIRWPSAAGRYYHLWRVTNIVSSTVTPVANYIAATVPENVYTDAPPSGVVAYYYRITATTNQP